MKDIDSTSESTSALYVGKKFSNTGKKPYFNKNFKNSNPKAESSFKPYEKKEFNTIKKYFYCEKLGHVIKDCRIRIAAEKGNKQTNIVTKPHRLYVVALTTKEESTSTWYVDFRATQHINYEKDAFTNYEQYENQQVVYLRNDMTSYKIQEQGDVTIRLLNGMERIILDVLYILGLAKNLFSAKQLDTAGREIQIKSGISTLFNKLGHVIAKCKLYSDLYKLGDTVIPNKKIVALPTTSNLHKAELWHLRLDHINSKRLKQTQSISKGMNNFSIEETFFL